MFYLKHRLGRITAVAVIWMLVLPTAYALAAPEIDSLSLPSAEPGTTVTVMGSGFYADDYPSEVHFDNAEVNTTPISSTELSFTVPEDADCQQDHTVQVVNPNRPSNGRLTDQEFSNIVDFNVLCPLEIHELSHSYAKPGTTVNIMGQGFSFGLSPIGSPVSIGRSVVLINSVEVPTTFVSNTELTFVVPQNATCGPNSVQVRNPSILGAPFAISNTSNLLDLDVFCIERLSPAQGEPGTEITIHGGGFVGTTNEFQRVLGGSETRFDGQDIGGEYLSNTRYSFTVPQNAACGEHSVSVFNNSALVIPPGQGVESNALSFEVTGPPCNQGVPPPDNGNGDDDRQSPVDYDADRNCRLSDIEFFAAVDDWIAELIDNALFFEIVDAWIADEQICLFAASGKSWYVAVHSTPRALHFVAPTDAQTLRIEIYSLHGKLIATEQALGQRLAWNMKSDAGVRIANGVYLYRVNVKNSTGEVVSSDLRKLVVVR